MKLEQSRQKNTTWWTDMHNMCMAFVVPNWLCQKRNGYQLFPQISWIHEKARKRSYASRSTRVIRYNEAVRDNDTTIKHSEDGALVSRNGNGKIGDTTDDDVENISVISCSITKGNEEGIFVNFMTLGSKMKMIPLIKVVNDQMMVLAGNQVCKALDYSTLR